MKIVFRKYILILNCLLISAYAFAEDEVAVDFGTPDARSDWRPYEVTRNPYLIIVPVLMMVIVFAHLFRRERRKRIRRDQAESYFND